MSSSSAWTAAMDAIDGSRRIRTSSKSWTSFFLSTIKVKPSGSSTIPGVEATYVPDPWRMVTILREARSFIASRMELRPAFNRSQRIDSLGRRSPGCNFSSRISAIISSEILEGRFFSSFKFIIWFKLLFVSKILLASYLFWKEKSIWVIKKKKYTKNIW